MFLLQPASSLSTLPLRVEARSQIWRDDGAQLILPPKHPIANASNEIISTVKQTAWDQSQNVRENLPTTAHPSHHVNRVVRAHQQLALSRQHDETVRQVGDLRRSHTR